MTLPEAAFYLEERYVRRPRSARLMPAFYRLKPLIPRRLQMAARRRIARRQRDRHEVGGWFPRWPIEPLLVDRHESLLAERVRRSPAGRVRVLGNWPRGNRFAYIVTHDVEGPRGLDNVRPLLDLERRRGIVSAWFIVAEDYHVPPEVRATIRAAGGEVGLHGLHHDGSLFQDRGHFEAQLPRIRRHLEAWGAEGFRSPATHRRAEWMPELGAGYDSSFPDTHPFDAQPGGCCSIVPYFLGELVELPITLPQDHTLYELLREPDIGLWRDKAAWIAEHGGLVTVLVHPDYALTDERLRHYDALLAFLSRLDGGWHALPRDVARWWRRRAALAAAVDGERAGPAAVAAAGAELCWAAERDGRIVLEREAHALG
jgi:peptidoglycan/xylan/chitin deacetylase (PgdA/CDA1 family)